LFSISFLWPDEKSVAGRSYYTVKTQAVFNLVTESTGLTDKDW